MTTPTRTEPTQEPRPIMDPDEVREPEELCDQQKREEAWEAM